MRTHQKLLSNSTCAIYLDSNNAIAALLRGDSCDSFIAAMVATFWKLAQRLGMAVWSGRVRSKLNADDLPTRHLSIPFDIKREGTIGRQKGVLHNRMSVTEVKSSHSIHL